MRLLCPLLLPLLLPFLLLASCAAQNGHDLRGEEIAGEGIIIRGDSLAPLVPAGSEAVLQRDYYNDTLPQRGDIVAYAYAGNDVPIAKIVKAIPGDAWSLNGTSIIVNGEVLRNSAGVPYAIADQRMLLLYTTDYPVIPEDNYLILGDNPYGSLDATRFGLIHRSDIVGRIVVASARS